MTITEYLALRGITAHAFAAQLGITPGRLSQLRDADWPPSLALEAESASDNALDAAKLSTVIARARG